jgi:uncharacterized membrane protein YcaP (DUF421 family)
MQPPLHPFDLSRLLIGENPGWFMLEVVLRILIIYFVLMVSMRMMGKRVVGQMSASELAVIVMLGAALGVPVQMPDRGLLPAVLIVAVAVALQRGLSVWRFKTRKVEVIGQGDVNVLLQDGRILLDQMRRAAISRERLFALLRARSIEHLGQVRRVYLETSGDISLYRLAKPKPGLTILPDFDDQVRGGNNIVPAVRSSQEMPTNECNFCHNREWSPAVEEVAVGARKAQQHDGEHPGGPDGHRGRWPDERLPRH